ncbi:MAG: phage holin family protein [Eubacteriales bacterium]|nr:phage holin family protein [Eubacteriales bacterium]
MWYNHSVCNHEKEREAVIAGIFRFLATAAAAPACSYFMDGVHLVEMGNAILVGLILAAIYTLLRPLLRLLLSVINFCTLGLLYVAADAWLVWTAAELVENSLIFDNFWWALAVAVVVGAARTVIDAMSGGLGRH